MIKLLKTKTKKKTLVEMFIRKLHRLDPSIWSVL